MIISGRYILEMVITALKALPSSNVTRFKLLCAAATWIFFPVEILPVKLIFLTRICAERRAPVSPAPVKTCKTPFGKPAFSKSGATAKDPSGLFSEGLTIRTLPVARQGAALIKREATGEL